MLIVGSNQHRGIPLFSSRMQECIVNPKAEKSMSLFHWLNSLTFLTGFQLQFSHSSWKSRWVWHLTSMYVCVVDVASAHRDNQKVLQPEWQTSLCCHHGLYILWAFILGHAAWSTGWSFKRVICYSSLFTLEKNQRKPRSRKFVFIIF